MNEKFDKNKSGNIENKDYVIYHSIRMEKIRLLKKIGLELGDICNQNIKLEIDINPTLRSVKCKLTEHNL